MADLRGAGVRRRQLRIHFHPVRDFLQSLGDNPFTGRDPIVDYPQVSHLLAGLTVRIVTLLSAPTTPTWYWPCVSSTAACGTSSAPLRTSVAERILA